MTIKKLLIKYLKQTKKVLAKTKLSNNMLAHAFSVYLIISTTKKKIGNNIFIGPVCQGP